MSDLIKRIDFALQFTDSEIVTAVILDMRAELLSQQETIERLNGKALNLKYELDCLNESGAGTIEQLQKRIAELSKPYVPMTDDEAADVVAQNFAANDIVFAKNIEAEVCHRAGIEVVK